MTYTSPTNRCAPPASTADCSVPDRLPPPGGLCAIHQPNLFPRLTTLAKLVAADYWIVLDDVQFARRDYQHRARLAALADPQQRQWLTIPTHLPHGRSSFICDAVLAEPVRSRRRVARMLAHYYAASPYWPALRRRLAPLLDLFDTSEKTAEIAEASTRLLLDVLGWHGQILRSSRLASRPGRSQRLADLAHTTGAAAYLCGTGGMAYLQTDLFTACDIDVVPFRAPTTGLWQSARQVTSLWPLMAYGPQALGRHLRTTAATVRPADPATDRCGR